MSALDRAINRIEDIHALCDWVSYPTGNIYPYCTHEEDIEIIKKVRDEDKW